MASFKERVLRRGPLGRNPFAETRFASLTIGLVDDELSLG